MLSRRPILALACIGPFWLHGQLAQAQAPAPISPAKPAVSMDQARRIAADHGVVRIEVIKLDDDKWKVEGRDSTGASTPALRREQQELAAERLQGCGGGEIGSTRV